MKRFLLCQTILLILIMTMVVFSQNKPDDLPFTPPVSIEPFQPVFHFAPVNQDTTNSCWSFATTSFIESEVYRIHGREIKLSVMFPVYYAFLEKARVFVETKGTSLFMPGDLFPMVIEMVRIHGIVPESVYQGRANGKQTYNHRLMEEEIKDLKKEIINNQRWDQEWVQARVRAILDTHLGAPPVSFTFNGSTYTPKQFAEAQVDLVWDDYLLVMSFTYAPFNTFAVLRVPDNWKKIDRYFNVPLGQFYMSMISALKNGYSVAIDGDIGEPGRIGKKDVAYIPAYDIPGAYINQQAREYRFDKNLTTDDHLMHIVGYTAIGGNDWFLVKDSWRDAFEGAQKGYFFYNADFARLKILAFLTHKDAVPEISALSDKQ